MRCCDVALKPLATRTDKSLTQAAAEMGEVIDRLAESDILDFGPQAYEDAKGLAVEMAEAMTSEGQADFQSVIGEDTKRAVLGFQALLFGLLYVLAAFYGISPSEASRNLCLDVAWPG